jgi:hypothetical protein
MRDSFLDLYALGTLVRTKQSQGLVLGPSVGGSGRTSREIPNDGRGGRKEFVVAISGGYGEWVKMIAVKKVIRIWQKHALTHRFYGSPSPPTSLGPDTRVRCEGYGGLSLDENFFNYFGSL